MDIEKLLSSGQFENILNQYYESVKTKKLNSKKSEKYEKRFKNLMGVFYACYYLGFYKNCVSFGKKIIEELSNVHFSKEDKQNIYHIYFESVLYCYINKIEVSNLTYLDLSREIESLSQHRLATNNVDNNDLLLIYNDYCKGKMPYYVLSFLIPYAPLFKEYTFDLSNCFPFISMAIKENPRTLENGVVQDVFTLVEFKIKGITHKNPMWEGDDWEYKEKLPHIKKCLPILNMLYLYAGNSTKTFVPTICIEQISSTQVTQYTYDNTQVNWSMGTNFATQWVGLNVPRHTYTIDELKQLNEWVVASYGSEVFISLFQQAKNNLSAGLYVESFLLLCSCCESMLYYWCGRLCKSVRAYEEYEIFSKSKISSCDVCPLYIKSEEKMKFHSGMEPSIYKHIDYLVDKCKLSKQQGKKLRSVLSKIRNDTLRNDIVHGRTNKISLEQVNQSMDLLMELQEIFLDIEKQILNKNDYEENKKSDEYSRFEKQDDYIKS
ncbi:MAG: hypothetical protein ACLSVX_00840 [Massilimicrobiota timonensis]